MRATSRDPPDSGGRAGNTPPFRVPDHTLLRRIGKGAYGEVWVARNTLGTWRAVKFVRRSSFADDKPFERELAGIQRFEPISRSHESQLNILHVGRAEDGFYYVMELADDMGRGQEVDEATYTPRNLRSELHLRGRLPVAECLRLGLALTTALEHLHKHGLVHRDIKPSNIVFVNGIPKLADIGLVARAEATASFVGTEGFIPPEGPGTREADIYSLGKVLYEISTGHDRNQFPELPTNIVELPDRAELSELNEVLLKACHRNPQERYQSAAEMHADLALLQSGKSVARLRHLERNFKRAARAGAFVTALAALIALGWGWQAWQTRRVTELAAENLRLARRAEQASVVARQSEAAARRRAYASDINLAQQALSVNNLGRALELLNRQRPEPGQPDLRDWEWRYLWQQCRGDALSEIPGGRTTIGSLAASPDGKWLAIGENGSGMLSVWDLLTQQLFTRFKAGRGDVRLAFAQQKPVLAYWCGSHLASSLVPAPIQLWNGWSNNPIRDCFVTGTCQGLWFSTDDERLAVLTSAPGNEFAIWNVATGEKLAAVPVDHPGGREGTGFVVTRDLKRIASIASDGSIRLLDTASGRTLWSSPSGSEAFQSLAFSPDETRLAAGAISISLWDVQTGARLGEFEGHNAWVSQMVFSPDGQTLFSSSADQTIRIWDLVKRHSIRVLRGHQSEVWRLALFPASNLLASGAKDGSVYLWDRTRDPRRSAVTVLPTLINSWSFAPDGKSVLTLDRQGRAGKWEGTAFERHARLLDIGRPPVDWRSLISPRGRWLAAGSTNGEMQVWDLEKSSRHANLSLGRGSICPVGFRKQESQLLVFNFEDDSFHEWDLLSGVEVRSWPGPPGSSTFGPAFLSPDEQWCLMPEARLLRNLTTGTEARIEARMGSSDNSTFSPDGRQFALASFLGYVRIWTVGRWEEEVELKGFLTGVHSVAYSPDARRLASGGSGREAIRLWDAEPFHELLTLEGDRGGVFLRTAFSADGNAIGSLNTRGQLHLWTAPSALEIERAEAGEAAQRK